MWKTKKTYTPDEELDERVMKANPGVPKVGRGTVLYNNEEDIRSARMGAGGVGSNNPLTNGALSIPGIPSLPTAPKPNAQPNIPSALPQMSGSANFTTPVLSPMGVNTFQAPRYTGFQTPTSTARFNPVSAPTGFQTPTSTTRFIPQYTGFQTPTSSMSVNSTLQVVAQDGTVNPPVPKSQTYDPNDAESSAEWRAWWNWNAQHPAESKVLLTRLAVSKGKPDPFAVHVPTRQEVWNMKAEQRRRAIEANREETTNVSYESAPPLDTMETSEYFGSLGNPVQQLSWRVG